VSLRIWKAGDHEVVETVLRKCYEPQDALTLEEPTGGSSRWTVISVERDPHGWRTIAKRCLPGCLEHSGPAHT
jgi:hypothetical protein